MKSIPATSSLVYSTEGGRICPACRQSVARCRCKADRVAGSVGGAARTATVWRETKGRAGKAVTVVRGLALDGLALAALCKQLKTTCGCGGTVKDGQIEVQGDHAERLVATLQAQGFVVKRAG